MTDHSNDGFARLREVRERTGLSRATIYRKIAAGTFPRPLRISVGCTAWYRSELDRWVADPAGWREAA